MSALIGPPKGLTAAQEKNAREFLHAIEDCCVSALKYLRDAGVDPGRAMTMVAGAAFKQAAFMLFASGQSNRQVLETVRDALAGMRELYKREGGAPERRIILPGRTH